jgi:hypothetical protein
MSFSNKNSNSKENEKPQVSTTVINRVIKIDYVVSCFYSLKIKINKKCQPGRAQTV